MHKRAIAFMLLFSALFSSVGYAENIVNQQDEQTSVSIEQNMPETYAARVSKKAYVSNMEIYLDGQQVKPTAYLISVNDEAAYTYFKLRDLAYLMKGKDCQFSVSYDAKKRQIIAESGKEYTPDGSEMKASGSGTQTAYETNSPIYLDGKKVEMEAYTINDNTYYKLRDMGEVFGFDVSYKDSSRQAIIRTPSYTGPDTPEVPDTKPDPDTTDPNTNPDTVNPNTKPSKIDGVLTVLIDVGHGGSDGGSNGTAPYEFINYKSQTIGAGETINEKDFNLPVALYLRDILKSNGVNVIISAETDKYLSFAERKKIIENNANKADMLISVHHNSAGTGKAKGFEILAQIKYKNGGDGLELAQTLEKYYYANGRPRHAPTVFREGSNGDYYAILRYANNVDMLAIISEYAYMDNPNDIACVLSEDGLKQEAQAMNDAILEYFKSHEY